MDESSQNSEKSWLIRSSTRIMGPYTLDEVTQMLTTKQISIIDEIRQPLARWSYIRENRTFLDLVKNLRQEQDNAADDHTMTSTFTTQTFTKTDAMNMDDLTPTPIVSSESANRQQSISGIKDITQSTHITASRPLAKSETKKFGVQDAARIQAQIELGTKRLRYLIFILIAVVITLVSWSFLRKTSQTSNGYEEAASEALRYKNLGLYEKALDAYKRIQGRREPDAELQFQMAPLLISEDRQSLLGRRILEKALLSEGRSRADQITAHIGIALTYMQEGDLKEAENYLQKSMTFEPNNADAQTDMAIIQLKKGNYAAGAHELDALAHRSSGSSLLQGLRAIAWIESSRTTVDTAALRSLETDLKNTVAKNNYLRQELNLLWVRVEQLLKDKVHEEEALQSFIAQVPFRSSQFKKSLSIDWRMMQWDYLEKYCAESFSGSLNALQKMSRSICLMEVNRDEDANRLLTEALSESPKSPAFMAVEAAYFMKVRRNPEALAVLKGPEMSSQILGLQLEGSLCMQQGDSSCAKKAYSSVNHLDPENVYALYGLSWVALQESKKKDAYEFAKTGLQAEPGYLPLIELRDRLESP